MLPLPLQKRHLYLIAGIALAVIAIFMLKVYLDQQQRLARDLASREFAKRQASQTSVLVAKQDIPRDTLVRPESLEIKIVSNQSVQPGAVTSLERIAGMTAIAPISKGEQINLSKLSYTAAKESRALSEVTPQGKRAITISVDNVAALAGMIKAGDYVDVIALVPTPVQTAEGKTVTQVAVLPIFQNVLVLAVGQETSPLPREDLRVRKEEKKETSPLITLALSPQEASLIAFVQEQGKIRLTLRSPTDSKVEPVQPASWETLLQYVFPRQTEEQYKPGDYVEIYRGLNKEKVLISK